MLTLYLILSWAVGLALGYNLFRYKMNHYLEKAVRAGFDAGVVATITRINEQMKQKENTND